MNPTPLPTKHNARLIPITSFVIQMTRKEERYLFQDLEDGIPILISGKRVLRWNVMGEKILLEGQEYECPIRIVEEHEPEPGAEPQKTRLEKAREEYAAYHKSQTNHPPS